MKSLIRHVILGWFFCVAFRPRQIPRLGSLCFSSVFSSTLLGWPERGNHLFARRGAFKGPLQKFAHSHTRPMLGHVVLGLTNRGELSTPTGLETFHPFTQFRELGKKKRKSWERGYRPHYFLAYWAALKSSKAITGLSPTTQASWPEGISYASPGPASSSLPSSRTTFNLPEIMKPT